MRAIKKVIAIREHLIRDASTPLSVKKKNKKANNAESKNPIKVARASFGLLKSTPIVEYCSAWEFITSNSALHNKWAIVTAIANMAIKRMVYQFSWAI